MVRDMLFGNELIAAEGDEITIQTRIGVQTAGIIDEWGALFKSRNEYIASALRQAIFLLHNAFSMIEENVSDDLLAQMEKSRLDTVSILVKSRFEKELSFAQSCTNSVQINMKISKSLAKALSEYNDMTVKIESTQIFINFVCYLQDQNMRGLIKENKINSVRELLDEGKKRKASSKT